MTVSAIRAPSPDIANHQIVLSQLKEETETGRRIRGNANDSFVTLGELISAGIVNYIGKVVSPGSKIANSTGGGLTSVSVTDSITGAGTTASPIKLVGDVTSPGNNMLYGTNGSGARGWYSQPSGGSYTPPVTTKGDLFTYGTTPTRLAVGSDGQVLTARSTAPDGIDWETPSSGGSVSVTDGTHTVSGATSITFSGATVSGTSPNATVTISGGTGGSNAFNITPDTHTSTPTFVANDEFEGATLDTAGTRFSGATPWAWFNQGAGTAVLSAGSLILKSEATTGGIDKQAIMQTLSGSSWTYQAKCAWYLQTGTNNAGLILYESATGNNVVFGVYSNGSATTLYCAYYTGLATGAGDGSLYAVALSGQIFMQNMSVGPFYLQVSLASGTISFALSQTGLPGTFQTVVTVAMTAHFTTAADHIGLFAEAQNASTPAILLCDWFRRIS